jgi:hypothetical protein
MTEFDEDVTIRRIMALYRERGREMTPQDVRLYARQVARKSNLSLHKALEAIEADLLEKNPRPEKWD